MDRLRTVGVLDKTVAVLLALRAGPLDLRGVQSACDLPRATAHRLLTALEQHRLVRRGVDGRFRLGLALVDLGRAANEQLGLADLARPALRRLRDDVGESVQLFVREGDARRCVLSLQSPHALRWIVPEGDLLPLARGSAGHVLSRPDPPPWIESVEEREAGVASVSAPVRGPNRAVIAAVSVSGPIERLTREPGARFGGRLVEAAGEIERLLGGSYSDALQPDVSAALQVELDDVS